MVKKQNYKQFEVIFYKSQMSSPKIGTGSSIRRRKSKIRSSSSFTNNYFQQTVQVKTSINDLVNRFASLSKEVKVKPLSLIFNFSQDIIDSSNTIFDKNYATAKLRGIQNRHTLNKANQQLLQREKKILKNKGSGYLTARTNDSEKTIDKYQQKLDVIMNDKFARQQKNWSELLDDSDQEIVQLPQPSISPQKGLLYYDQLKNHPKILNYTLRKMKSRKTSVQIEKQRKNNIKKEFRQGIDQFCEPEFPIPILKKFYSSNDQSKDPLQIQLNKLYRKVYSKKSKNFGAEQARQDPILSSFLRQQEKIVAKTSQTIVSKQNCEEMKQRFDKILGQMYRNSQKYRNIQQQQIKTNQKCMLNSKIIKQKIKMFEKQRK